MKKLLSYLFILCLIITAILLIQRYNSKMLDPNIAAAWANFAQNRNNTSISVGNPVSHTAKDAIAMYRQVTTFLLNSIPYNKNIPKTDENVGICGNSTGLPPVLVISDKQHTMTIHPAYYLKKEYDGSYSIQFIPGVLLVNIDDKTKYIQNQSFFNWLIKMQWQPYFNLDLDEQTGKGIIWPDKPVVVPSDFNFSINFGYIDAKNRIDTYKKTFTKDLIMDGTKTVSFTIPPEEMEIIYAAFKKYKISELPNDINAGAADGAQTIVVARTPEYRYSLTYTCNNETKTVVCNDGGRGMQIKGLQIHITGLSIL